MARRNAADPCQCGCGQVTGRGQVYVPGHRRKDSVRRRLEANIVRDENGCWIWQGYVNLGGYGRMSNGQVPSRSVLAHRASYELYRGPIPEGLHIDHLCRVRRCVNPDHLEPVTQAVNTLRGEAPNIVRHRSGLCKRGHDLNQFGYRRPDRGHLQCTLCADERRRARKRGQNA